LELPIREPATIKEARTAASASSLKRGELEVPADFEKLIGRRRPGDWEFETEGFQCGPSVWKTDDHSFTNMALLTLARKVSTAIRKLPNKPKEKDADRLLAVAFRGWLKKARYRKVRRSAKTYWKELFKMFSKQMRSKHPEQNASTWTRWRQHVDFPRDGSSRDKILFAIRKHCEERATNRFYLGMRDAGRIAGISHVHAGKHLQRLRAEGRIDYNAGSLKNRGGRRKAQKWILVG
jgi:hypothetical protein